jgi:hypothetical protein
VRQGRTDAWIAHQLEATVQQIQAFKREQELEPAGDEAADDAEVDLRAQDDAAIAAELEAEAAWRARSTTARRATGCGSTPPCRTTPSTPSTGRATVPSRSRSRRTRS